MNKQIKFGVVLSYLSIVINLLAGVIYTPWMVKQIGKSDYGLYTLANSLISMFLMDFGLSSAVSRFISKYRAEGKKDKIDDLLGVVYKLYLIIDAVIFIILLVVFCCIDSIYVKLTPEELIKFKVVYMMSALFAVINFPLVTLNGIMTSYEKFIQLKLADVMYRILLVGLTVIALLRGYGLYALVGAHAFVGLVVAAYKLLIIKKEIPVKVNWSFNEKSMYCEIFGFSVWITISMLAQRLIFNITPSILGIVTSSDAIAVFGIITTIEGYVYTITTAINGMFMPKISRIYEDENAQTHIMPLMLKVGRFQYALNGLIIVGFVIVGKSFIHLWMGASYSEAYYGILLVLIPGLFFNAMQIANTAMIANNKVKYQASITLTVGMVNVVLSLPLSYHFGVVGACISIFIAYMIRDIAYFIIYQKVMKFDMWLFTRKCHLRMSIPILITILFGFLINYFIEDGGIAVLVIKGLMVVVTYLVSTYFTVLDRYERTSIIQIVNRKIRK